MEGGVDLSAYLARVGHVGPTDPTLATLRALHAAHTSSIPFESLDPLLGQPVRLDAAALEAKLLRGGRGGYCFEQNGVFFRVLRQLGFQVTPLAARVRWMLPEDAPPTPLSHMLLKVDLPEGPFLADVGFGGQSPTEPLRLEPGLEQAVAGGDYRVLAGDGSFDLQLKIPAGWQTMYRFTLEPRTAADYEVANWFTSTHPQSRFTNNLVASRVNDGARVTLFNTERTVQWPDGRRETSILEGPEALRASLKADFGIDADEQEISAVFDRLPRPAETA